MKTSLYAVDYVLPPQIVKTTELMEAANTERFGISNKLIEKVLGIEEVRHATDGVKALDLAVAAAEKNFENSDIKRGDIDMVIYAGMEGQFVEPSTAHFIQQRLGIEKAMSFDTPNACMGFVTALQIAHWAIQSGQIKYALICTGEVCAKGLDKTIDTIRKAKDKDYVKKILGFLTAGDAGGSVIIGPSEDNKGILGFNTSSHSEYADLCYYYYNNEMELDGIMEMSKITSALIKCHEALYPSSLSSWKLASKDIDCLICHQVGKKNWYDISSVFNIGTEKMIKTYDKLGNLTSVTPIVNIAKSLEVQNDNGIVFGAFAGSGLSVSHFAMEV